MQNLAALANIYMKLAKARDEIYLEQVNTIKNNFKEIANKIFINAKDASIEIDDALGNDLTSLLTISGDSGNVRLPINFVSPDNPMNMANPVSNIIIEVKWHTDKDGLKVIPKLLFYKDWRPQPEPKPYIKRKPKPVGPFTMTPPEDD